MRDNAAALDLSLTPEHRAALDLVSAAEPRYPYGLFTPGLNSQVVFGGHAVRGWRPC